MTYEEFKESRKAYPKGTKCFVMNCNKEGLWEGGDSRFYCGMCEEHVDLKLSYKLYTRNILSDDARKVLENKVNILLQNEEEK